MLNKLLLIIKATVGTICMVLNSYATKQGYLKLCSKTIPAMFRNNPRKLSTPNVNGTKC